MRDIQARIWLCPDDRAKFERWVGDGNRAQKLVTRARIVLASGRGLGTNAIMREARVAKPTVWRWQTAYLEGGVQRLATGRSKPPGKRPLTDAVRLAVVEKTAKERPADATHWSVRSMAKVAGISHTSVQRIWKAHGLKPHLTRTFKLSNDPKFTEKVEDIVGLYLDPPANAIVLSVDEKSQIQALDRTQPGLPLKKGRAATMTHDYKRNGTTTLFAALVVACEEMPDLKPGAVISDCLPRHRAKEFLSFLKTIDRQTPAHLDLHLVLDNYATHKTEAVRAWLAKHPRFKLHFTPTSSSWLNLVERLFAEITRQRIRRGVFKSVPELIAAIEAWIAERNRNPKAFAWTAQAATILGKVARARQTLDTVKAGTG